MSDQLQVDLGKLHDLSGLLSRLHSDLDNTPSHIDAYGASMGHPGLATATQTLGDDWAVFRYSLLDDITNLGTFAEQARAAYQNDDTNLSKLIDSLIDPPPVHNRYRADF